MKPVHYLLLAGLAAFALAGGSSKSQDKPQWPGDRITEETRAKGIELLKEAYKLNGNSMNAWGSYYVPPSAPVVLGPLPPWQIKPEKK